MILWLASLTTFDNVHVATTAVTTETMTSTAQTITTSSSLVCPKCGTNRKSGKVSCCAAGGSWFKKCGDPGDVSFEHTWSEGVEACERKCIFTGYHVRSAMQYWLV